MITEFTETTTKTNLGVHYLLRFQTLSHLFHMTPPKQKEILGGSGHLSPKEPRAKAPWSVRAWKELSEHQNQSSVSRSEAEIQIFSSLGTNLLTFSKAHRRR